MFASHRRLLCLAAAAVMLMMTGCTKPDESSSQESSQSSGSISSAASASVGSDRSSAQTDPGSSSSVPSASASTTPEPVKSGYDFTQPAPEREAVESSYFKNSAFVGDSRTDGFLIYSGINNGKNLTSNGLSIFQLKDKKALTINDKKYTLLEALSLEQYDQVYLSLGVNELGYFDDDGFYKSYCDAIDAIRAIQPKAVIYIQNLIPLNEQKVAETSKRSYLKNDHLRIYNDLMRKAAEEHGAVYLDLYSAFVDSSNSLPYDASKDGVHLNGEYCKKWLGYLQTHTVSPEDYFAGLEHLAPKA